MVDEERPTAAFLLSLVAGVFILLGAGLVSLFGYGFMGMMNRYGRNGFGYGMMGQGFGMMGQGFGTMGYAVGIIGIVGLIFGAIVVISAYMLNSKPKEHQTWGTLIVIFSVLSIFGSVGGFGVGLLLGIIGGVLGITWKPPETKK
jgi:hypothetical protein